MNKRIVLIITVAATIIFLIVLAAGGPPRSYHELERFKTTSENNNPAGSTLRSVDNWLASHSLDPTVTKTGLQYDFDVYNSPYSASYLGSIIKIRILDKHPGLIFSRDIVATYFFDKKDKLLGYHAEYQVQGPVF